MPGRNPGLFFQEEELSIGRNMEKKVNNASKKSLHSHTSIFERITRTRQSIAHECSLYVMRPFARRSGDNEVLARTDSPIEAESALADGPSLDTESQYHLN
jgi:hypothetical protein